MPELWIQLHDYVLGTDRIPVLMGAILLTLCAGMVTGPLVGNANPMMWLFYDVFLGRIGDRLNKKRRARADLLFRGFILSAFAIIFAWMTGNIAADLSKLHPVFEILFISVCLTSGAVWFSLLKLYFALEKKGSAKGAFRTIARSVRVDLNGSDDFGITRAGLAFSATSFDKGLVAPCLWYLIGGLPVLFIYSAVSALAWRFGKSGFSKGFGVMPLVLEKLMGCVFSLFSGFIFTASSSVTPTASFFKSIKCWWQARGAAPYEQGGPAVSALAWSLNVSLGGPVCYIRGGVLKKAWIGPDGASAKTDYRHLKRALVMNVTAHLIFILALLSVYIYADHLFLS